MLSKIVVGIDADSEGRDALTLARTLAPQAQAILVNAYPHDEALSNAGWQPFRMTLDERAVELVERARRASGLPAAEARAIAATSPARGLQDVAAEAGADLVVVGSSHRSPRGQIALGDVARSTLNGSPCPVAVAPRDYAAREISRIGVAFDGSREAQDALRFAADLAVARRARLQILQVIDAVKPALDVPAEDFDAVAASESLRLEAQVALDEALFDLPVEGDAEVVIGAPDEHLRQLARFSDLVVTGSRRFGQVRRVVLGSTSDRLIHGAQCPVLVVPRGVVPTSGCDGADASDPGATVPR